MFRKSVADLPRSSQWWGVLYDRVSSITYGELGYVFWFETVGISVYINLHLGTIWEIEFEYFPPLLRHSSGSGKFASELFLVIFNKNCSS